MENRKALTMTVILLLLVSTLCTFLSTSQLTSQSKNSRYPNWNDKNGNNVDDLIDYPNSMGPFDIFIDYGVHPNQTHITTLNVTISPVGGYISSVYRYIDTIAARNVPQATIYAISSLADVTMVWKQPMVKSFLNTSARAIKARHSTVYSDEYVWAGPGDAGDSITKGENITIAVLDTGVDDEHDSLTGKFLAGFDATKFEDLDGDGDDDIYIIPGGPAHEPGDGSTNPDDLSIVGIFHGTHCASTALGNPSDDVYMGVAPQAKLVDIKVLTAVGSGSMDDVIEGIEWAQNNNNKDWGVPGYEGIDVLSISLGSSNASDGSDPCSRAVNNAVEAGIVVVVAAGNDGPDNDGLGVPAAADSAITVAAVDDNETIDRNDDTIADFSSRGPRDDDGDTDSYDELKPEVAAHGVNITAARGSNIPDGAGTAYHELSGTSMATPHVAGVAALILSQYENIGTPVTPEQVDEILRYTAEDKDGVYNPTLSNKYDIAYGWGIVDAYWTTYPHDIAVTAVTTSETWVLYGDSLQIDVTVENQGGFPAMSRATTLEIFDVSIYYDSQHIETKPNISLLPGDQATIPFTWNTAGDPIGEHLISARASVVPLEFETSDNYLTDGTVFVLQPLEIGIIGPVGWPHWSPAGMKEAAEMARDEINAAGGIDTGSGYYGVKLVFGDEHAYPFPEPYEAALEMERLCDPEQEGCDFVIGGFRTECTTAMIEVAADYGVPFFINGAFADALISDTVGTDYARYKYLFRINPVNSTMLLQTIAASIAFYLLPVKLNPLFGHDLDNNPATPNQTKIAVLSEDLAWTIEMHTMLSHPAYYPGILGPYANVTYAARIPDGTTDVSSWIQGVIDSEARLLIHIFSGVSGIPVIATWKAMDCGALPVGINVLAQMQNHWVTTGGACDYECILNFAGTRTPIVPGLTEVFWDNFVARTGAWPLYTAWGAYDGIYGLKEALEEIGTIDKDLLVNHYENPSYERQVLNGRFKYTSVHDVYSNEPGPVWTQDWSRAFIVQWQVQFGSGPIDGRMEVVCPVDQVWSKKWAIPPWMYELVEDINYDGMVDMRDVGQAARAFGTYPGHERWEKEADINYDDQIDMMDIGRIARQFGETISLPLDYP